MVRLLIAGDYCPKDRVLDLIEKSDYGTIFKDIKPFFDRADYSIVNLEAPILIDDNVLPIGKEGPALKCSNKTIDSLKYLGVDCVTLANNHFRDYGDIGAISTMKLCASASIDYVGAGKDLDDAKSILYKDINEYRIAIINCCEHEYSIAGVNRAGSNPLNPVQQYYAIKEARQNADYVIIIIHGGIEHYHLPSPRMVDTYRFFIDAGADAVINHHQHCFSGYEIYNQKPIFYGLGNFCFDWSGKRNSIWNEGYLVYLNLGKNITFEIEPYEQCNLSPCIIAKNTTQSHTVEHKIKRLNEIISDPELLNNEYKEFLNKTSKEYDVVQIWSNKYLRALFARGFIPSFIPKKTLRALQNRIMCESHRERLLHLLNNKLDT